MKKKRLIQWLALLLTGALLLCFAACRGDGPDEPPTEAFESEPENTTEAQTAPVFSGGVWSVELRGVPNALSFTSEDAQYLPKVQIEMTTTNPETGLSSSNTYGGVTLRSVLNLYGVQNVLNVTVASLLGPAAVYTDVMAMAEDTVLAWEIDGALIDTAPPLRMCPRSGTANDFIRQVTSLTVVPASAAVMQDPNIDPATGQPWAQPPMGITNDYNYTTTTTTSYPTYAPADPNATSSTTESTTTTTTQSRTSWTTPKPYTYVGPSSSASTAATKPAWWPDGVPWPPED